MDMSDYVKAFEPLLFQVRKLFLAYSMEVDILESRLWFDIFVMLYFAKYSVAKFKFLVKLSNTAIRNLKYKININRDLVTEYVGIIK